MTFHQLTGIIDHGEVATPFIDVIDIVSPSESLSLPSKVTMTGVFSIVLELSSVATGGLFKILIVTLAVSFPPCQSVIV
jgi:hypothetical protein